MVAYCYTFTSVVYDSFGMMPLQCLTMRAMVAVRKRTWSDVTKRGTMLLHLHHRFV